MNPAKYAVTFACYNQVDYTRQCIDSMLKHGFDLSRLVVVDNDSSDATRDYLQSLPLGGHIYNRSNLGCGTAWNQGILALQAEWSVIMNNDVLVSAGWLENLITSAEQNGLKLVSPALIEGPLDYDFDAFSETAAKKMGSVLRRGGRHAVCLAVHESVWQQIGYFQPVPKLLGYEDTLFFHEADKAGIPCAISGASWLHHYGSITQTAMKQERGLSAKQGLGNRYNYRLLQQSWMQRKWAKYQRVSQAHAWRQHELAAFGMTLHGKREAGEFFWY
ncbi:glycosyltransferase family 2 protein [Methylomonas rhizoryzae]|uniref:glycosyltransferase family 2 protein n=1 Tax=Methylomonas rhizoryzae TaxID=2608981 RepID=UPI0012328CE3|nr:glycosyltransferase [Methylomonas rhizoryzae]